jgi:hypothetical protein
MSRRRANIEDLLNDMTYVTLYNRIKNLALNMFVWEGLPDTIKPEYIEKILYTHGRALFFKDKNLGLLCLQAEPTAGVNVYGEHTAYYGVGFNYRELYDVDSCVLVKNNILCMPTDNYVVLYASKLQEIERTMDVNVKALKTPYVIACDDKDILTFKAIFKQIDGNTPAIYADKNLNLNSLDVLDIKAPFVCDKLADYKHDVWNDCYTFLGINNANTDKRERLVSEEVTANNEAVQLNAEYMLEARQTACQELNSMFGLNVSVKRREVKQDESIYTGTEGTGGEQR